MLLCRGLVADGADAAQSSLSIGAASNSGSASFLAYTPTSTLAITGTSNTPHSVSGSVAGPLALTPVRRMDLPHKGMLIDPSAFCLCLCAMFTVGLSQCRTGYHQRVPTHVAVVSSALGHSDLKLLGLDQIIADLVYASEFAGTAC